MSKFFSKKVLISESYGWEKIEKDDLILWFKGYLFKSNVQNIHLQAVHFLRENTFNMSVLSEWVNGLNGHFAFILISVGKTTPAKILYDG